MNTSYVLSRTLVGHGREFALLAGAFNASRRNEWTNDPVQGTGPRIVTSSGFGAILHMQPRPSHRATLRLSVSANQLDLPCSYCQLQQLLRSDRC